MSKEKRMQDKLDIKNKVGTDQLSDKNIENINGGIVLCLGEYPSEDEYQVIKNDEILFRTNSRRDAVNWANEHNCDPKVYTRY